MVTIEIHSCGEWHPARFGILSRAYAVAMLANLKERGTRARIAPSR